MTASLISPLVYHISLPNLFSLPISLILCLLNYDKQAVSPRSGHEPLNWSFYNNYPGGQTILEPLAHQDNCGIFAMIMLGFTPRVPKPE
jgi:hypothetical protein